MITGTSYPVNLGAVLRGERHASREATVWYIKRSLTVAKTVVIQQICGICPPADVRKV